MGIRYHPSGPAEYQRPACATPKATRSDFRVRTNVTVPGIGDGERGLGSGRVRVEYLKLRFALRRYCWGILRASLVLRCVVVVDRDVSANKS